MVCKNVQSCLVSTGAYCSQNTYKFTHTNGVCVCTMNFTQLFILLPYAGQFPSADGLIAPGMHCTYTVTFSPDSLANYQDELRVLVYFVYRISSHRFATALK